MKGKAYLAGMAVAAFAVGLLGSGCASSSGLQEPGCRSHDTAHHREPQNELSPLAPVGATNVKRVGNQWTCEQNGRTDDLR